VESGLLYSHLGAPGAEFFGTGAPAASPGGDGNLFLVPLHLWGGYHFEPSRIQAGLSVGADLLMRTDQPSIALGRDGDANFFPAFGFKVGWDPQRNFALNFQANWSLAPNAAVFAGLLGATIPLA
jgi:hypothetical protein